MTHTLPNAVSQLMENEPGHIDKVLYIMKCIPVTVDIRRTNRCYNELPIEVNNETKLWLH